MSSRNRRAAAFASVHAVTFSSSVSSAVSMITLLSTFDSRHADVTARMSRSTRCRSPDFNAPTLMTMSISRAPSKIARRVSYCFVSAVVAPSGKPDDRAHRDRAPPHQPRTGGHPRRVHADAGEAELRRLAAERFDLALRRVRLQQRVVDHRRHVAGTASDGMETKPGRTGLDDRGHATRAALVEHRVAGAPRPARGRRRRPPTPRR